jgi:hypothetical protein
MTDLAPQRGDIPVPQPTPVSQPFWDGLARHALLFQRCARCGGCTHTPALVCAHCHAPASELAWEESNGRGTVYSWTVVWRPQTPAFTVPYAPVIVDLEEGWQMLSSLIGCPPEAVRVGLDVMVDYHAVAGGITLPYFRPR